MARRVRGGANFQTIYMISVNFYLKKENIKTGKSLIYLKARFDNHRLVFCFGQTVFNAKKNWDYDIKRFKNNSYNRADGIIFINNLLDNLKKVCERNYNSKIEDGKLTASIIRKALESFFNKNVDEEKAIAANTTLYQLIDRFIAGQIGRPKAKSTLKDYRTAKACLLRFDKNCKIGITYEKVTLDLVNQYTSYMKSLGLAWNTQCKRVRTLRVFLGEAYDLGYTKNLQWKHKKCRLTEVDVPSTYLNDSELMTLYHHDFSQDTGLHNIVNAFLLGAFTGCRYSDWNQINFSNIIDHGGDKYLRIKTKKTQTQILIAVHSIVLEILEHYKNSGRTLKIPANQHINRGIKTACKKIGLTEKGRLSSDPEKELWQTVSSHTARRSAVSNLYIQGCPIIEIMALTGHKTQSSFMKYLKLGNLTLAKTMDLHMKNHHNSSFLKAI